jgi:N-acetylgalactosamine-6-sulfatase
VDLFPTLHAAAGISLPEGYQSDGVNLLPLLMGQQQVRNKPMFWQWLGNHSQPSNWPVFGMREGPWTLLADGSGERRQLYHVLKDREQQSDVAAENSDRVRSMLSAIHSWKATLPDAPDEECRSNAGQNSRKPAKPTPDRARTFRRWDTDGDGTLTLEEYTAGLTNKPRAADRFKNFDKDGNGKLSHEEFVRP